MTTPPPVEPVPAIEITAGGSWSLAEVAEFFADLDSIYLYAYDQALFAGTAERFRAMGEDAGEGDAAIDRPEVVFLSLASPMVVELAAWAQLHLAPSLGWMLAFLRRPTGTGGLIRVWPRIQGARADSAKERLRRMEYEQAIQRMQDRGVDAKQVKRKRKRKGTGR
jgi:hypothetical protein